MKKIYHLLAWSGILLPRLVLAQPANFSSFVQTIITGVLRPLTGLLFGVALVYFLWGVVQYIGKAESEEDRKNARNTIVYGIVAMAVMVAVWGLVQVVVNTFFPGGVSFPSFPPAPPPPGPIGI